jgi:hypothetical protein
LKTRASRFIVALILDCASLAWAFPQENFPQYPFVSGSDTLIACGECIFLKTANGPQIVAQFTVPTLSMLLSYRPGIRDNYGYDTTRYKLMDMVESVTTEISSACLFDGRIWVGLGFYEGEGSDGFGGIGFYDLQTGELGVLRHPALLDYSTTAIKVSKDTIYAATRGQYEGATSVGNGLVAISRRTLLATARVPKGSHTIWDKDGEEREPVAPKYDRPIEQLIADSHFIRSEIANWPREVRDTIRFMGADQFMVHTLAHERWVRQASLSRATTLFDEVIRASGPEHYIGEIVGKSAVVLSTPGYDEVKQQCGRDGFACFTIQRWGGLYLPEFEELQIRPPNVIPESMQYRYHWITAKVGDSWSYESSNSTQKITIDSLVVKTANCNPGMSPLDYFESVAIHVKFLKLKD